MKFRHLLLSCILLFSTLSIATATDDISIVDIAQLISDESYKKAKTLSLRLLKSEPENDAAWCYLGYCYFYEDNLEKAMQCWERASEIDPDNSYYMLPQYNVYSAFPALRSYADSLALVMAEKWPEEYNSPYTLCLRAEKEMSNGRDSTAALLFQQALTEDPNYVPAIMPLAEIYRTQDNLAAYFATIPGYLISPAVEVESKVEYLKHVLNLVDGQTYRIYHKNLDTMVDTLLTAHPTDSLAISLAGSWDMVTGRKDQAYGHFEQLTELYPKSGTGWFALMSISDDDPQKVIQLGEEALRHLDKTKDQCAVYVSLANTYFTQEDYRNSYKYLDKAIKLEPHDATILNNYAYYLSTEGKKLRKAEKMSREALRLEPENVQFLDTYGYILYLMKDYENARTYFKKCMVYGGKEHKVILEHYAMTLYALGDIDLGNFYMNLSKQAE